AGIGGARSRGFAGGRGDLLVGGRVGTAVHPASAFLSACSREHQNVPPCVSYPTERGRRGFPKWARRLRGSNQDRINTGVELGRISFKRRCSQARAKYGITSRANSRIDASASARPITPKLTCSDADSKPPMPR